MQFYGFISNGFTAALIGPDASVDWWPLPRFDSPSVFTRLLGDDRHGFFRIAPEEPAAVSQAYVRDSNVLATTFVAPDGRRAILHDFLTVGRPELRRVLTTRLPVRVCLRPVFGYGLVAAAVELTPQGAVFSNPQAGEALALAVAGPAPPLTVEALCDGTWVLPPGRYHLILRYISDDTREERETVAALAAQTAGPVPLAGTGLSATLAENVCYWRERLACAAPYQGRWREAWARALLVLYGLTYRTNGAIIAAPTTSLPEEVGGTRQWDYRFAWIRDGSYAAEALIAAGDVISGRHFLAFLLNSVDIQGKPFPAPFFHVDGTLIRGEREMGWLPGYRRSRPCREGNAASHQQQLDVEGDFLWVLARYVEQAGDRAFLHFYWPVVRSMVEWVRRHWAEDDASLWEFRDRDRPYTHSRLMCWVALTQGARMAEWMGDAHAAARWRAAAESVRADIETHGVDPAGGFYVQAPGTSTLDAALLLMPLYGYVPAGHPRFLRTLEAIERELVEGPLVFRYREDMLGQAAHPFLLASSWLARVYLRLGRRRDAARVIDGLAAQATDLGLLGEHTDRETGSPRGNFPQAFSHLGLLSAILEYEAGSPGPETAPSGG